MRIKESVIFAIGFVAVVWGFYLLDIAIITVSFSHEFGLVPRTAHGLIGIAGMTFVHANLFHIVSNTLPLLVLLILTGIFIRGHPIEAVALVLAFGGDSFVDYWQTFLSCRSQFVDIRASRITCIQWDIQ